MPEVPLRFIKPQPSGTINPSYESGLIQVALNTTYTLNHGLSDRPRLVELRWRCITAQSPFSVGDEAPSTWLFIGGQGYYGAKVWANATQIKFSTGNAGLDADQYGALLTANWRAIVRAWL